MSHVVMDYEDARELVREALPAADWQMLHDAAEELIDLDSADDLIRADDYAAGWNDCRAAIVATLAVHLGVGRRTREQ